MTNYNYDSDDARNRSPSLEPTKVIYEPHESPVPFISDKSESPKGTSDSARRDCANRPELLNDLIDKPHPSHVSSESDESGGNSPVEQDVSQHDAPMSDAETTRAAQALTSITEGKRELDAVDPFLANQQSDFSVDHRPQIDHMQSSAAQLGEVSSLRNRPVPDVPRFHPHHGPVLPRITTDYPAEERPIATSPSFRLYTISPLERLARETLPALQSPPQSSSVNSPTTSLPPLKATFPEELSENRLKDRPMWLNGASPLPAATSSPSYPHSPLESGRRPPDQFLPQPLSVGNPYIQVISPASSQTLSAVSAPSTTPSQQSPWHLSSRSERSFTVSPGGSSSQMSETPSTGYPSPNETRHSVNVEQKQPEEHKPKPREPSGPGGFKCSFPGCTAAPFQTQYLLNSHANVHSQERPYFCPVKGCRRGQGGEGFKRKNEMIRHGLVHDSPGYVCPFCPDQQHKYPRPDNLQRHVRVHHVDKSKDDPLLRQVLAQRPEGLSRGRKRRT